MKDIYSNLFDLTLGDTNELQFQHYDEDGNPVSKPEEGGIQEMSHYHQRLEYQNTMERWKYKLETFKGHQGS